MPAYIIVSIDIRDPEAMKAYSARVPAVIKAFGGRYLARGAATTTVEGEFPLRSVTILEFPSLDAAQNSGTAPSTGSARRCARNARQGVPQFWLDPQAKRRRQVTCETGEGPDLVGTQAKFRPELTGRWVVRMPALFRDE